MSRWLKTVVVILLIVNTNVFAQCPPNIGLEDGTFNHWQCFAGKIDSLGVISVSPTSPIYNRHTIITATPGIKNLDPYGKFPMLCPNGSKYSLKLGNDISGSEAERVTYDFNVPAGANYTLVFNYAVVFQNPNHADFEQPKFTVKIYNVTDGTYLNCPAFNFVASANIPGFKSAGKSGGRNSADVYYKDWSASTINLVGYGGKSIQLEFTTNDCTKNGHFGYAYIDVNESCSTPITGNAYCNGQQSVTLYAPSGFYDYYWYTGDMKLLVGHGPTLTLSPAPPDLTKYALTIVPYMGLGCPDTLYTVVNKINTDFNLQVPNTIYGCPGTGVNLTALSVTAGSSAGITLSYHTDPVTLDYLYTPEAVTTSGTYYIRGISPEGCINILPVNVVIIDPSISVTDPPPVQYPAAVDITATYPAQTDLTYSYYTDAAATTLLPNPKAVDVTGTYYIKVVNKTGCITVAPVKVVIEPPNPYTITAPNVFTPNADGVNDHFMITIKGFVSFNSLKVYDRYGQLIFNTTSPNNYWDGSFNNNLLPAGTYYWLFDGTDQYYHTKVTKASSITLIK